MMKYPILCLLSLAPAALAQAPAAPQWKIQYFYDKLGETLEIEDIAFPSAKRGIAVGSIFEEMTGKKPRYTALVTSDGGEHWTQGLLKERVPARWFSQRHARLDGDRRRDLVERRKRRVVEESGRPEKAG